MVAAVSARKQRMISFSSGAVMALLSKSLMYTEADDILAAAALAGQGAGRCRSRGRSWAGQRRGARQVLVILSIGCAQPTAPAVVPAAGQPATTRASGAARRSTRAGGVPRRPTISRTWRAAGGRSGRRHQRSGRAGWVALVQSRDICPALVVRLGTPHHQWSPAPGPIPFHFQVSLLGNREPSSVQLDCPGHTAPLARCPLVTAPCAARPASDARQPFPCPAPRPVRSRCPPSAGGRAPAPTTLSTTTRHSPVPWFY